MHKLFQFFKKTDFFLNFSYFTSIISILNQILYYLMHFLINLNLMEKGAFFKILFLCSNSSKIQCDILKYSQWFNSYLYVFIWRKKNRIQCAKKKLKEEYLTSIGFPYNTQIQENNYVNVIRRSKSLSLINSYCEFVNSY